MAKIMDAHAIPTDPQLYVYGAGGHGLVVAEAAEAAGWEVLAIIDTQPPASLVGRWRVLDAVPQGAAGKGVIVAIGDNMARRRVGADLAGEGLKLVNIVHPSAVVSTTALLGRGIYIGPQAVVNAQASLADGVIVNSAAVVEHHCQINAYTHVGPRAALCGNVKVGSMVTIGAGASVIPGKSIADDCIIGAGAAVVDDISGHQTVVGVPARPIQKGEAGDFRLAQ